MVKTETPNKNKKGRLCVLPSLPLPSVTSFLLALAQNSEFSYFPGLLLSQKKKKKRQVS